MRRLLKGLLKLAALVGLIATIAKLAQLFKGSPDGVGGEGFSFTSDADDDPYAIDEGTLGGDVSRELLDRLVCPLDKGPLELVDGKWLVNRRNGFRYPITDGIPVMLVEVGERYRDPSLVNAPPVAVVSSGNGAGI